MKPAKAKNRYFEAPGQSLAFRVKIPVPENVAPSLTTASGMVGFDKVKGLLSNKPLRRSNRTRPLDR